MSHYSFNIEISLSSGVNHEKLFKEIRELLYKPSQIYLTPDTVEIDFTQTLTGGEETILNNIISTHSPEPDSEGTNLQIFSLSTASFNNTIYQSISTFTYPGKKIDTLTHIKILSNINISSNYSVRIYDIINNKVIAENTFNNITELTNDMGTLSNIPFTNTIFDVQVKVANSSTRVNPKTIIIYYN